MMVTTSVACVGSTMAGPSPVTGRSQSLISVHPKGSCSHPPTMLRIPSTTTGTDIHHREGWGAGW